MINTLFLTTVAVEPSFVAFRQHSRTYVRGLACHSFKFLWRTGQTKPPTILFGIVACTFSDNLSRNSCKQDAVIVCIWAFYSSLSLRSFRLAKIFKHAHLQRTAFGWHYSSVVRQVSVSMKIYEPAITQRNMTQTHLGDRRYWCRCTLNLSTGSPCKKKKSKFITLSTSL